MAKKVTYLFLSFKNGADICRSRPFIVFSEKKGKCLRTEALWKFQFSSASFLFGTHRPKTSAIQIEIKRGVSLQNKELPFQAKKKQKAFRKYEKEKKRLKLKLRKDYKKAKNDEEKEEAREKYNIKKAKLKNKFLKAYSDISTKTVHEEWYYYYDKRSYLFLLIFFHNCFIIKSEQVVVTSSIFFSYRNSPSRKLTILITAYILFCKWTEDIY